MNEQPTSKPVLIESAQEISDRARKVDSDEWTRFGDHFFHGCCDCGLSHTVRLRRVGDAHEVQFEHNAELTEASRAQHEHPIWKKLRAADEPEATPPQDMQQLIEAIVDCEVCRVRFYQIVRRAETKPAPSTITFPDDMTTAERIGDLRIDGRPDETNEQPTSKTVATQLR